jgi:hypothetical protein
MMSVDRNEFLRGAMATGSASFAHTITGEPAATVDSTAVQALLHVQRLVDAASDRLRGALANASSFDPALLHALDNIKRRSQSIAAQIDEALPLG